MKKSTAILAIFVLTTGSIFTAHAAGFSDQETQQKASAMAGSNGGFIGPSGEKTTAKEAKTLSDDTWIILTGKIEKRIGGDNYVFRDGTDSINVEIDDKYWNGQTITPQDTVEIQGKVDKDRNSVEVDVKKITKK